MNKRLKLFYFGFFLLQFISIYSEQNDDDFARGNQLFEQQKYIQACDVYQNIENKGFIVLYNLALSYLNRGHIVQAIVYAKRAENKATFQELTQLYELLDCIHRQFDPDYELNWDDSFIMLLKKCILSLSLLMIQCFLIMLLLLLMVFWYKRLYSVNMVMCSITLFFYLLFLSLWFYKMNMMQQQIGIVTKELTIVFSGPDESFSKKSELHEFDQFVIVDKKNCYYQVKTKQDIGWIHDSSVELV